MRVDKVDRWLALMRSYPSDGWDGAADVIAAHDKQVCDLERTMDESDPSWREGVLEFQPRT